MVISLFSLRVGLMNPAAPVPPSDDVRLSSLHGEGGGAEPFATVTSWMHPLVSQGPVKVFSDGPAPGPPLGGLEHGRSPVSRPTGL